MLTLNLVDKNFSDIMYEKIKFTDTQVSIKLDDSILKTDVSTPIFIVTRFNNYDDLFYLLGATEVLQARNFKNIYVGITCLLGQRSDQRFDDLQSFDLKIIANILNSQNYTAVILNEPHSAVSPALINNSRLMPQSVFMNFVMQTMAIQMPGEKFVLVSPDAGAYKRIYKLAEKHNLEMVAANKVRYAEGPRVTFIGDVKDKVCVILDDYCDGGRTFIQLAQQLREQGAKNVVLAVPHFLASFGIECLMKDIDFVITTNSIRDIEIVNNGMKNVDYTNFIFQQNMTDKK
jgi:ribose-phosphate pyrophosphokinase